MPLDENYSNPLAHAVWLRHVTANEKGRDFVVGDIHGCVDELLILLARARFNPKRDRLFSVGDLVDRGPRSIEALDLLEKPWFFAVRGNHEQMLLDHWDNPEENPPYEAEWLGLLHADSLSYYKALIEALPHVIKVGEAPHAFYILHAELWDSTEPLSDDAIDQCLFDEREAVAKVLWSRHIVSNHWRANNRSFHDQGLSRIFCGHSIVQAPTMIERSIYLDTGACAPYVDSDHAQVEHYGLSLVEARTLRHWFAPTCEQYRGTVVEMPPVEHGGPSRE